MKFSELKKSAQGARPDGLNANEELAWRCMSYLNALLHFKCITADQVRDELDEIEWLFMCSLSPYDRVRQLADEKGDPLIIAYKLMAIQPDTERFQEVMGRIKEMILHKKDVKPNA